MYQITADSIPDFDSWGPDGYHWTYTQWKFWYDLMRAAHGTTYARDRFRYYWNQAPRFSFYGWSLDQSKVDWLRSVGITEAGANPLSLVARTVTGGLDAVGAFFRWLPVILIVLVISFVIYKTTKK